MTDFECRSDTRALYVALHPNSSMGNFARFFMILVEYSTFLLDLSEGPVGRLPGPSSVMIWNSLGRLSTPEEQLLMTSRHPLNSPEERLMIPRIFSPAPRAALNDPQIPAH